MKRSSIQALKFLAVSLVLYVSVFFALTRIHFRGKPLIYRTGDYYQWKGGVAGIKFREWDPQAKWDAIVVGSSHAYRGYDPRVFATHGYRVFNLGSTAQTPLSTYAVLDHYVDSTRTKLVIFDLYENAFVEAGIESASDLTQNLSSNAAAAELAWNLHDLRGLNMFTLRLMNSKGPAMYGDPNYKGDGFSVKPDSLHEPVRYDIGRPLELDEAQTRWFGKCLDLCARRGIRVVLTTHFYPHQSDHERHAAFVAFVDSTIAHRGLHYFDFAYAHTLSDTDHFSDRNHMNEAGARIFNERLVDSLVTRGYLSGR